METCLGLEETLYLRTFPAYLQGMETAYEFPGLEVVVLRSQPTYKGWKHIYV